AFVLLEGGASHYQPLAGSQVRVENVTYREDGQPAQLPEAFFSSDFYTDKLIEYLERGRDSGKPFFAWAAYTAPHWPLHAPREYIDKYRGRYDAGYEVIRQQRQAHLQDSDLFVSRFPFARTDDLPSAPWQELSAEQKA